MYTSDIDNPRRRMTKTGFFYLALSLFCVLFGAVYEYFSHGVYSFYMLYAFVFPLLGGVLPYFILAFSQCLPVPGRVAFNLYNSGIATLTTGSIFTGVLEIYGTSNRLVSVYWIAGAALLATGILLYLAGISRNRTTGTRHRHETMS